MAISNLFEAISIFSATGHFLSLDTNKTTRIDFTAFFLHLRHAPDAYPYYIHLFTTHQQLAKLLIEHPAMVPNLQQTFSTPANSKNKVYFMWDFIVRTFQFLAARVDPKDPESSEMFQDVLLRAGQSQMLVLDDTGTLEKENASLGYRDDEGVEFTEEIKGLAATMLSFPDCCAGCGKKERGDGGKLLICAKCKKRMYCSVDCQRKR